MGRDETLPDITLLPAIAELFRISIDELFGDAHERKGEEFGEIDRVENEAVQQGINHQITDIVNREFEIGISE